MISVILLTRPISAVEYESTAALGNGFGSWTDFALRQLRYYRSSLAFCKFGMLTFPDGQTLSPTFQGGYTEHSDK